MKNIWKEYKVEILALAIFVFGIVLLTSQSGPGETFGIILATVKSWTQQITRATGRFLGTLSFSDLYALLFIGIAVVFVVWRIRVRFGRSAHFSATKCPRCGSPIKRVHRNIFDRILERTFMPGARRFRCYECYWSGLRHERIGKYIPPEEITNQGKV